MNTSKVYLFVMFILAENIQKDVLANSSVIKPVTFYENTKSLHIMFNKLFSSLKLKDSFRKTTKIRLLLTIHKCLLKIIKGKHYKLREIKTETGITTIKGGNNKNNLFEILQDNTIFPENCVMKDIDNDVYKNLLESIKQFLYNIDKLKSGFEKKNGENDIDKYQALDSTTKLKVWVPNGNHSLRRIYNSRTTTINWYSFMASVHVNGEFVCAGAIIKKYFVITAASCLYNRLKDGEDVDVSVRVGSEFTTYGGVLVAVTEVYLHYQFNPETLENNLAILRMDNKIRIAKKKKKKISKIAFSKEDVTIISSIFMLGWGAKTETNEQVKFQKLSYAYVDLYDLGKCKNIYSGFHVTDNNFCTGLKARGSGACAKDIGDPAIVDGRLVGVVSFGPPLCGTPDAPTVFTKISHYTQWIESIVNKNKPDMRPVLRSPKTVTSMYPAQRVSDFHHIIRPVSDYPEEIMILREILEDLEMTNGSLIDEIIEESFDKEILDSLQDTTKTDLLHHPLINKSIVPIHGVHIPEKKDVEEEYHPVSLTTSNLFTYLWQGDSTTRPGLWMNYDEYMDEYWYYKTRPSFTTTLPRIITKSYTTTTTPYTFIPMFGRVAHKDEDSSEATSTDEESKGLSIEMTTAKIFDEPSSQESQTETVTETDSHLLFDVDSDSQYKQKKRLLTKKGGRYQKKMKKVPSHRDFQLYTKMLPEGSFEFDYTLDISIEKK